MKMPRILKVLDNFKDLCKRQGWKTCENEDWVQTEDGFHNFLCARDISSSSFKKVASERKCVIEEGSTYHVVQASYTAWLFPQTPPDDLVRIVTENPDFNSRTALYDFSLLLEGETTCPRLNNTASSVFQEFEKFLQEQLDVQFEQLSSQLEPRTKNVGSTVPQLA
jgi:hypothetical protein